MGVFGSGKVTVGFRCFISFYVIVLSKSRNMSSKIKQIRCYTDSVVLKGMGDGGVL